MPHRTLLAPGQIWTPQAPESVSRKILDFLKNDIVYEALDEKQIEIRSTHYLFKKWIKNTQASLSKVDESRVSPKIELAQKIFALRKSVKMSQVALSEALNISRSAVASLETGRTGDIQKHLPKLAQIFQVPVEFFLDDLSTKPVKRTLSADENILVDLYRTLTPEKKIDVQKYIERKK